MPLDVEVRNLLAVTRKLEQVTGDLRGEEFLNGMREATMIVTNDAKLLAPVDSGRLRNSITPEIRSEGRVTMGVVGSNVKYAAAQETGTRPFMPPVKALETWARRHGTSAWVVARAIARRGIKGKRYMQRAFEKNRSKIRSLIGGTVAKIVRK